MTRQTEAVSPPPDGGYPNETTAEGDFALFNLTTGYNNTALGYVALLSNTTGSENTAVGAYSLDQNTTGGSNVAVGDYALLSNVSGGQNTALGSFAGAGVIGSRNTMIGEGTYSISEPPTEGDDNTGVGFEAFRFSGGFFSPGPINNNTGVGSSALSHCQGNNNTATGFQALRGSFNDDIFSNNTAMGYQALLNLDNGNNNTAVGSQALFNTTTGNNNTAAGSSSLFSNTTGARNTAQGASALLNNTAGRFNTAIGNQALQANTTGTGNIALGDSAGINLTTGNNNIDIGNGGNASEAGTIRIGKAGTHTATFIAGITGTTVAGGVGVIIGSNGKLGTVVSSERFKDQIKPMDKASEAILALKPVTFRYRYDLDPDGIPQFGLVAEDVEKVDPDLVARDEQGKPYSVRYDAVNAMLLNEFLKEHRKVQELQGTLTQQERTFESKLAAQQRQIEALTAGLQKVSARLDASKFSPQLVLNSD